MPSGRPLYEPNPASQLAGHEYAIGRLKNRLAPPNGSNPRIAFGQIDGVGGTAQDAGSEDWAVETDFAGTFTITFDPPFDAAPTVTTTENETSTSPPSDIQIASRAVDTVVIKTYKAGVLTDDIGFDFIAVGVAPGIDGNVDPDES